MPAKKSTYFPNAQKNYNNKCAKYAVKYTPAESSISDTINLYCRDKGLSNNAFIKQAIREKLEKDGYLQ